VNQISELTLSGQSAYCCLKVVVFSGLAIATTGPH